MGDLLNEFFARLLGEAKKPGKKPVKRSTKKPAGASGVKQPNKKPANAIHSSGGKWYSDKQHTQYVGMFKGGEWIPATPAEKVKARAAAKPSKSSRQPRTDKKSQKQPKIRKPREQKEKIEPTEIPAESVTDSFGDTLLDIDTLMSVIQGMPSQEEGDKGAGTIESTAGEAATVLGIERLRQLRAQNPDLNTDEFLKIADTEITTLISQLRGVPDSVLDSDWAVTARRQIFAVFHTIETTFNARIDQIAWDNASGRTSLGLPERKPRDDRSDMYVRTVDGRTLGVSLKKSGKVFLANDGLKKALTLIGSSPTTPEETKQKIIEVSETHKENVHKGFVRLASDAKKHGNDVRRSLRSLSRYDIEDVESDKYDQFFDANDQLRPEVIKVMISGDPGAKTAPLGKLFIKCMSTISDDVEGIRSGLVAMRAADTKACQELLTMVDDDENVRRTVTDFLINGLDLVQLVSSEPPFGEDAGVDGFFVAYGEAGVRPDGSRSPMVVTRQTVLRTLGLPENISDDEFREKVKESFIIDSEDSGKMGFIRLRVVNNSPPPPYFYPAISQLTVRSKGLGTAASLLMEQGTGWTFSLRNGDPNPANWPAHERAAHASDNILFLWRQLKNPHLTKEQKANIEKEIEEFRKIEREAQQELASKKG